MSKKKNHRTNHKPVKLFYYKDFNDVNFIKLRKSDKRTSNKALQSF